MRLAAASGIGCDGPSNDAAILLTPKGERVERVSFRHTYKDGGNDAIWQSGILIVRTFKWCLYPRI